MDWTQERSSSTVADYLHFPSDKNTNIFSALYSKNFDDISNFQNAPQP